MKKSIKVWRELGNIPMNENEETEASFRIFPAGTHREKIWRWIEEEYNVKVHDLMFLNETSK